MEELIPNYTLFIQLGIFFASYMVLNQLVFKPYGALIRAREAKTSGLMEKAAQERESAAKLKADYEAYMKTERKQIAAVVEEDRRKIADEERAIISTARDAAGKELQGVRKKNDTEFEAARKELLPLVQDYSSQIASKLMGRNVKVSLSAKDLKNRSETEQTVQG